jgi:endonuclease/exonuclease/phosphatase family metal-dependent hydrolase
MSFEFKVGQLCLANDRSIEKAEFKYSSRHGKFCKFIADHEADIWSIKELRNGAHDHMQDFSNHSGLAIACCFPVRYLHWHGVFDPYYLGQLYNPKKLILFSAKPHYYMMEDCPYGTMFLDCTYIPLINNKPEPDQAIQVLSYHLPGRADLNIKALRYIRSNTIYTENRVIKTGDFNIFANSSEYAEQLDLLYQPCFTESTSDLITEDKQKCYGTFYPFTHDGILHPTQSPTQGFYHSKPDFMFHKGLKSTESIMYNEKELSDHFPIITSYAL